MIVEKFKFIFEGLDVAYGQHQPQGSRADGKQQGKSYMVQKEVTDELWEKHLEGEGPSLGIIPIRADNTAKWGCIDIDTYPLDHRSLVGKIRKLGFPLVYCKSKSGGAHLFLFVKTPIASKLIRTKLAGMASTLGQSNSEIFPKQSGIQPEKKEFGSFLNLPYFRSSNSSRYAIKDDGTKSTLEEFFDMYEKYSVGDIDKVGVEGPTDLIKDGPPCLQALCKQGFPEGNRNNGLFNLGVYLKKFDDQKWEETIVAYNQEYMQPPLPHAEVTSVINTLKKRSYQYKCKDQPIASYCNVSVCKTRKHGVGKENVAHQLGALTKLCTEPPIWYLEVISEDPDSDLKIQLSTEDLQIQTKFQKRVMEVLTIMPPLMKQPDWQTLVNDKMKTAEIVEVANDGSISGQFYSHLQEFCTNRAGAQNRDEITLRKHWTETNMEDSVGIERTYFRVQDLHSYLLRNKFTHYTNTGQIIAELRKINGIPKFWKLKGKGVNTWGVPSFPKLDSEYKIKAQDEIPF